MDNNKDLFIFCENIKKIRKKENLSKTEMSKLLGINTRTLSLIENGIIPPKLSSRIIFNIHHHFGILPQDMFSKRITD